jgi:hypothetical protein
MPKFYVTRRASCLVDFVTLVEADDPRQAIAIVDDNNDAGEYVGCSVLERTKESDTILSTETEHPGCEFAYYACAADQLVQTMREVVAGYDGFIDGRVNSVPLSNAIRRCKTLLDAC